METLFGQGIIRKKGCGCRALGIFTSDYTEELEPTKFTPCGQHQQASQDVQEILGSLLEEMVQEIAREKSHTPVVLQQAPVVVSPVVSHATPIRVIQGDQQSEPTPLIRPKGANAGGHRPAKVPGEIKTISRAPNSQVGLSSQALAALKIAKTADTGIDRAFSQGAAHPVVTEAIENMFGEDEDED